MSNAVLNINELNGQIDLVNRVYNVSKLNPLENAMRNSGIVRTETIAPNSGLVRRFAEMIVATGYSGEGMSGSPATQAKYQSGYEKDLIVDQHDMSISIDRQLRLGAKNPEIIQKLTQIASAGYNEIDLVLAHRLAFGNATTYVNSRGITKDITGGDGLAVFSASHPLTGSSTTWTNIVTGNPQFSKGAYSLAKRIAVENTIDNLGQKMTVEFDTLVTTDDEETVIAVKELLNATADVTSSNAGTYNVYQNAVKHVISKRIATTSTGAVDTTKKKYWFLGSSQLAPIVFGMMNEPKVLTPREGNNGEDIETGNWNYVMFADWGTAIPSGRGLIGSFAV
jgi:hypothetical protein